MFTSVDSLTDMVCNVLCVQVLIQQKHLSMQLGNAYLRLCWTEYLDVTCTELWLCSNTFTADEWPNLSLTESIGSLHRKESNQICDTLLPPSKITAQIWNSECYTGGWIWLPTIFLAQSKMSNCFYTHGHRISIVYWIHKIIMPVTFRTC